MQALISGSQVDHSGERFTANQAGSLRRYRDTLACVSAFLASNRWLRRPNGDLVSIRNYIDRNFSGWILQDVRRELAHRLEHASATYDAILRKLTLLYAKGLLDMSPGPEVHMEGASNLVGLDLHLTKEKMRELFRALEEKKRILDLLDRFLEQPAGAVGVHVGLGEMHPSMRELSLIGLPVTLDSGISAVIAVLGPMRMNYSRVMSAVQHVGQAFQSS